MRFFQIKIIWIFLLLPVFPDSVAFAGGFEIADQGARASGRAGAFTARADDLSAIEYNPAGLARNKGTHFYLSNRFSYANEEYRRAPTLDWSGISCEVCLPYYKKFQAVENGTPWQILGTMLGASFDAGLEDWGFAVGVYGPPAMGAQRFPDDGPQKYMLTKRDVIILYYTGSVAWKYKDIFGLGLSLQWVDVQKIEFELMIDGDVTKIVNPVDSRFDVKTRVEGADPYRLHQYHRRLVQAVPVAGFRLLRKDNPRLHRRRLQAQSPGDGQEDR